MSACRSRARERLALAVAAAGLIILAATSAAAQDKLPELKLSTAQGTAFPLGKAGDRWKDLLNERTDRAFEVKQYAGAVLAHRDAARELKALMDGAADLAVGSALAWSHQAPILAVYALPWLAAENRQLEALVADTVVTGIVIETLAAAGVVVLAIAPLGDRMLSTVKAPLVDPGAIRGLRVRANATPIVVDTLAALGARPTAMDFLQAQAEFGAGTLDGQDAPASTLAATRIAVSGQKFVTRWGAFADVMLFAVRRPVWDRWSDTQRAVVRAAAIEAATDAGALSREEAALGELTRQGVTLVRLAPAQRAAFRQAADVVWVKWTPLIGADLVRAAEAAVAAAPK